MVFDRLRSYAIDNGHTDEVWYPYVALLGREFRTNYDTDWSLLAEGFTSDKAEMYDFDFFDREEYVTDFQWESLTYSGEAIGRIEDKISAHTLFSKLDLPTPAVFGLITGGEPAMFSHPEGQLVSKPRYGMGGKSVEVHDGMEGIHDFNEEMIIEQRLEPNLKHMHGQEAVSTTRITTFEDPRTGETTIPFCVQRIPTSETGCTDNYGQGGIAMGIYDRYLDEGKIKYESGTVRAHPDTRFDMEGYKLPNIREAKEAVSEAFEKIDECDVLGWDVVLYDDRWYVLEANAIPGVQVLQSYRPLLRYPGVEAYYEKNAPQRSPTEVLV